MMQFPKHIFKVRNPLGATAVAVGIVALIALAFVVYFYLRVGELNWQMLTLRRDGNTSVAASEVRDLIARVGRHIVLPEGEIPTIATVTDPSLLKDQPFFANAKAGYKVLIYPKAKKAILYDPTGDKIIDVGPVGIKTNE